MVINMKLKLFISIALFALLCFASCEIAPGASSNSGGNTDNGGDSDIENQYFSVTFDTGVANVTIEPQSVKYMDRARKPSLPQVDGYRLLGWRESNAEDGELWSFAGKITENKHFIAVWEKEAENLIYGKYSYLYFVHNGGAADKALAEEIMDSVTSEASAISSIIRDESKEKMYHEIVIGKADRNISAKAYSELEKITAEDALSFLIYSDGTSLALAYSDCESETSRELLLKYFLDNCVKTELILTPGVVYSKSISVTEYYEAYDAEKRAAEWKKLSEHLTERIGAQNAEKFVSALKELYSLYTPEMTKWYANLYDPEIGGYYYSNSARDNDTVTYDGVTYPLLPDVESTNQALNFIISSGMADNYAKELPDFMGEQIISFVRSLQDPNGYFYHPQWPKELTDSHTSRRSRDLGWSENILKKFGVLPLYDTPGTMKGQNSTAAALTLPLRQSAVYAVSYVIPTTVNTNIIDKASFVAYLENFETSEDRNIYNHSYSIGNELTSQTSEILKRDEELRADGEDYSLMSILIEWLNKHQNEETGHWHHTANYYGVNGLLKISGIYNSAKVPMPNAAAAARSAIDAITSGEAMGAVVDLYNTWYSIGNIVTNLRNYGTEADEAVADGIVNELLLSAPDAILKSKEKISVFQKTDGSFSYTPTHSSSTSQGLPVAIFGSNEGDVNATGISSTGLIGNIMKALELTGYKPSLFGKTEFREYVKIIEEKNLELKKKQPQDLSSYDRIDFEEASPSDRVSSNLISDGAEVEIVKDAENAALVFTTTSGANDSLYIEPQLKEGYDAVLFFADITVGSISGSSTVYQIMFDSSDGKRAYMMAIGYQSGYITISDVSSTSDAATRREQLMADGIAADTKFNLGVEFYALDDGGVRVKVFIDKKLVYVSDNYYNSHKNDAPDTTKIDKMRFYSLNSAEATLTVDNVVFAQDNIEYNELSLGAK